MEKPGSHGREQRACFGLCSAQAVEQGKSRDSHWIYSVSPSRASVSSSILGKFLPSPSYSDVAQAAVALRSSSTGTSGSQITLRNTSTNETQALVRFQSPCLREQFKMTSWWRH